MKRTASRLAATCLTLLVALPGLITPGGSEDATGEGILLRLKVGAFDPIVSPPPIPSALSLGESQGYFIVQFDGPVTSERRLMLEEMGEVVGYIPDHALVLASRSASLRELGALRGVRWAGLYEPGFKLSPELERSAEPRLLSVLPFQSGGALELASRVAALGARVLLADPLSLRVEANYDMAQRIAFLPGVQWVEPYRPPLPDNYNAARIINARMTPDGVYDWGTQALWRYNSATAAFEGYAGAGFTAAVADTGVDGTHPAFNGKKVAYYAYGYSNWYDYYGHGTHTAGSVLGNGAYRAGQSGTPGRYAGMAPLAGLVGQLAFSPQATYYLLCRDAAASGAVVSSNSWGGGTWGGYDASCQSYDYLVRDSDLERPGNQSLSVCFSAGNEGGYGNGTVDPPSTAKNVISVGATDDSSGNSVAGYSSRGPCDDGRIKPDVVAPGSGVTSCSADARYSYVSMSGTSMSCPIVAGAVVVVNEYYCITRGALPSPAMVKSLLINGADPMSGYAYPGSQQGWGRLNLARSLLNQSGRRVWSEDQALGLGTGAGRSYVFNVTAPGELKVSLVWTDLPGSPGASVALVNDLDLILTAPNGTVYRGNWFRSGASVPDGEADRINNVEVTRVPGAAVGRWVASVIGAEVPDGPQDYAIVVAGPIENVSAVPVDIGVSGLGVSPEDPAEGDALSLRGTITNLGLVPFHNLTYRFLLEGENLSVPLSDGAVGELPPGESAVVEALWTAQRGNYTVTLEADPFLRVFEDSRDNDRASIQVNVRGYDIEISCADPIRRVDPGRAASFELVLRNLGNAPDVVSLLLLGELPEGWTASLDKPSLGLGPGEVATVGAALTAPSDALAFTAVSITVRAVSGGNSTRTAEARLSAEVNQLFGMELEAPSTENWVVPGSVAVHRFTLRNTGNGPDSAALEVRGAPDGWRALLSAQRVSLQANQSAGLSLLVQAPEFARALSQASLTISCSFGGHGSAELVLTTRVSQLAAIEMELVEGDETISPGATAELTFMIRNLGNGPDTVSLDAELPENWRGEWLRPRTTVEPGDYSLETLTVSAPPEALAGEEELIVRAVSGVDAGVGAELGVPVEVRQYYGLRLSAPVRRATVEAGNWTDFELTVANTGNGVDTFFLERDDSLPPDWRVTIKPSQLTLLPDGNATVTVRVHTPSNATEGSYGLIVSVYSWGSPSTLTTQKLRVELVKPPAPPPLPPPQTPLPAPEEPEPPAQSPIVRWLSGNWYVPLTLIIVFIAFAVAIARARRRARFEEEMGEYWIDGGEQGRERGAGPALGGEGGGAAPRGAATGAAGTAFSATAGVKAGGTTPAPHLESAGFQAPSSPGYAPEAGPRPIPPPEWEKEAPGGQPQDLRAGPGAPDQPAPPEIGVRTTAELPEERVESEIEEILKRLRPLSGK
ncbi:MAG: S8 family serine peptidase [Thermoplasmatota archaeon]